MRLSVSGQGTAVGVVWKQAACKGLWANSCTSRGHAQKNSQVRSGHSQSLVGRRDGGMRRSSFASLRWLILVLVFAVCLLYVLNSLCSVDQISALCLLFAFSRRLCLSAAARFKNHRKALVTSVDKKIPNGFMEEQGTFVVWSAEVPVNQPFFYVYPYFYFNCKFTIFIDLKSVTTPSPKF